MDYNGYNFSKYPKTGAKMKPTPIIFNEKNGQSSPKKLKLNHTDNARPKLSIQDQKRKLPIYEQRHKLLELIRRHSTLIILGETGCGKTTQVPQYILSARLQENGKIGITQPRRVAAISIAKRVTQELGNGVSCRLSD